MSLTASSSPNTMKINQGKPKDFITLLKPRVMSLSIFSALSAMLLAPGSLHPFLFLVSICAIGLGAGGAGALNMWYEHDRDALMYRTKSRPIPTKKIHPNTALAFGIGVSVVSVLLLGWASNWLAAVLLFITILAYVWGYTIFLKPRTVYSIVIGGISGALPPIIGWATVSGEISLMSLLMCLIIFMWTPAHFWALNIEQMEDYKQAGFPMYPNVYGVQKTKYQIVFYTVATAITTMFTFLIWKGSFLLTVFAFAISIWFIYQSIQLLNHKLKPMRFFIYSIYFLFFIFSLFIIQFLIKCF
ncbi:MAG: protoheme IX farnesyltransferase [Candidatus Puniceispirillum sp.]|nr:protoheme IX farnesyltransferase [Candidatus Pelagibacter sp.]MBA4283330.1 protoheme IX farnesyltransferase [Candidatus Puniceispirillum sp.]